MAEIRFRPSELAWRFARSTVTFVVIVAAGVATAASPTGLLRLSSGGTVAGEFRPSADKGTFVWQGADFTRPFEFASGAVSSVQLPSDPNSRPVGQFGLELASGDTVFGNISRFDADAVEIEVAALGTLSIKPSAVRRMYRIDGNPSLLFHGPSGLAGWKVNEEGAWQEDGPHLKTDKQGAMLTRDLKLPAEACIEFELAWEKTPAFTLSLGMNPDAPNDHRQHGFRFEVWDRDLVVVRENPQRADAAFIQTLGNEVKHVHLTVYLSQTRGSMQVYSPGGKLEASIVVAPPADAKKFGSGIRLINGAGDLRLEHLRVSSWNGAVLGAVAEGQARIQTTDGKLITGQFQRLDQATKEYVVKEGDAESRLPATGIGMVDFSGAPNGEKRAIAAICQDGTRLSGELERIEEEHLVLSTPDIAAQIRIPLAQLRTVTVLPAGKPALPEPPVGRAGRIELRGQRLPGRLIAGEAQGEASCLVWQPDGSRTASPIRASAAGRVVYRDPPPPVAQQAQARVEPQGNFAAIFLRNVSKGGAPKAANKKAMTLHLVSGDMIPCTAMKIGEAGVTIETPLAKGQLVPHDQVKAVELLPGVAQPKLKSAKKDRLLTLPRLQKASPPTHLLCSRTGDFLRCRLVELNDEKVVVEIQLENIEIPRERVAQIIWFHPEDLLKDEASAAGSDPSSSASAPAAKENARAPSAPAANTTNSEATTNRQAEGQNAEEARPLRAQVLRRDGNRVTFFPDRVTETTISGRSSVLGECEFNLADADMVIFGQSIELAAAELPYHQWKLHPALEPLIAQDLGEGPGGAPTGQESLLVGKPAPDFELDMLSGGKFKLSDCKGQIVVLDFWATWCGPCMQTMPLVEKAMEEFDSKQVRLVAVNLEEPAKNVQAVLERHNLKVQVALDEDGVAARKYEANAIPQTVIIDREGKVHRLYVGGGQEMVDALSGTLKELLGLAAEKSEANTPATGT